MSNSAGDGDSGKAGRASVSAMPYRKYFYLLALAWAVAVATSLIWNLLHDAKELRALTTRTAQALLEKDLLYREWSILHGGVYIPKTDSLDPAFVSSEAEREIVTPSGQQLTLLNPAVVSRQIFDLQKQRMGIHGHITSLDPIRPENRPDDWEREALKAFTTGVQEVSGMETQHGERHFRMMRPLVMVPSCLRCHEERGRKPGEIRGGISVAVPMSQFAKEGDELHLAGAHLGLWGIGIVGLVLGLGKLEHHNTERRRAEDALTQQYELTRAITENATTAIFLQDPQGRCTLMNPAAEAMTGYKFGEVKGKILHNTIHSPHLEDAPFAPRNCPILTAALEHKHLSNHESVFLRKNQAAFPVLCSASPVLKDGELAGVVLEVQDITDRKLAEAKIQAALTEKEALLQEIHHRVKNNLQIISSLLQLQINEIKDASMVAIFRESQFRIRSMALIHEKLYESDSLAQIDLADYLRSLTNLLFSTYNSGRNGVRLTLDVSPVFIGIDAAIPLGLIANELITNSLKFAFPDGRQGTIRVELKPLPDDLLRFRVADDGIGLPQGFVVEESTSLGLRLVRMLTTQIRAEGSWETVSAGTCFTLQFRDLAGAKHRDAEDTVRAAREGGI